MTSSTSGTQTPAPTTPPRKGKGKNKGVKRKSTLQAEASSPSLEPRQLSFTKAVIDTPLDSQDLELFAAISESVEKASSSDPTSSLKSEADWGGSSGSRT